MSVCCSTNPPAIHLSFQDASKEDFGRFNDWDGEKYIKGLNVSPSCDRGMSEVFSLETGELEWRLEWEETQNVDMLDLAD